MVAALHGEAGRRIRVGFPAGGMHLVFVAPPDFRPTELFFVPAGAHQFDIPGH